MHVHNAVPRGRRDQGMVTAETAVVLPVLLLVLAAAVFALVVVSAQLRCVDAARSAARLAARGEVERVVVAAARTVGPRGAQIALAGTGETVEVTVSARLRPVSGWLGRLAEVQVQGQAVARREQSLTAP